jgi:hypothetical protein
MSTDYIPKKDEVFRDWAQNLYTYVLSKYQIWNIPSPQPPLESLLNAYQTALTTAQNPNRGKVDVLTKNEARAVLEAAVRPYVKAYLSFNPVISDADREQMRITVYDKTKTPIPPPSTIPEAEIDSSVIRQLTIHFKDNGSERRGKPLGVHGVEIVWDMTETTPAKIEEFRNSVFDTRSPYTFSFDESQRGKKVFLCLRWENAKGEKGPWSEIYNAIIP